MFDQSGLVREAVKWDYELRTAEQLETVVDRALAVCSSAPEGPVYLMLPREVLASPIEAQPHDQASRLAAAAKPAPDRKSIAGVTELLKGASNPVIITTRAGFEEGAIEALGEFASRYGIPVIEHVPQCLSLSSEHPMHAGYDPAPYLESADLVLVLESPVPWIPDRKRPRAEAKVVHVGVDPLFQRIPIRGFECDVAITASASSFIFALQEALGAPDSSFQKQIDRRRDRIIREGSERRTRLNAALDKSRAQAAIRPEWITHCIEEACGPDAILLREAPQFSLPFLKRTQRGTYFSVGAAGGLGWSLGAAVGAKLAAPDRLVVAVVGDGSYMFGTPTAAHYAALEQDAPFLTVIIDNQRWNEVGAATRHLYPEGEAAGNRNHEVLTYFDRSLRLEKAVETVGGFGERVTTPAQLPAALARAVRAVTVEKRQAVLDVLCLDS
jgi:acetolactate synthase-1/2/3 large subunit